MRIEKVKSRKYKDKVYHKYRVVIPKSIMDEAGFKDGEELETEAKKGEIKLKRK